MITDFANVGFEWDEAKRRANVAKHGLDFLRVTRIFEGPMVTRHSPRTKASPPLPLGRRLPFPLKQTSPDAR